VCGRQASYGDLTAPVLNWRCHSPAGMACADARLASERQAQGLQAGFGPLLISFLLNAVRDSVILCCLGDDAVLKLLGRRMCLFCVQMCCSQRARAGIQEEDEAKVS